MYHIFCNTLTLFFLSFVFVLGFVLFCFYFVFWFLFGGGGVFGSFTNVMIKTKLLSVYIENFVNDNVFKHS